MRLILASGSPRRAELLRAAGFTFDVLVCDVDEQVLAGETADAYVRRVALAKSARAQEILRHQVDAIEGRVQKDPPYSEILILAADTAVVLDGVILGKPRDSAEARAMIEALSGRRHDVLTGISLRRGETEVGGVEHSGVYFNEIAAAEIDWFVRSGEGADKAGGYAIQGLASRFVWRLEGSYSNVVGLPVATVHELLRDAFGWGSPT
jgi:septum formation protein